MSSKLLSETIRELKLNPHAPYPWQLQREADAAKDTRDMIKKWRNEQGLRLVGQSASARRRGADIDFGPTADLGVERES